MNVNSRNIGFGVGNSSAAEEMQRSIARVAPFPFPVLLQGETGTGKELVARRIHSMSGRSPMVSVDCTGLSGELFASELFGHERGAFTGAVSARVGLLESAGNGTVFLDEIGELSLELQTRILRFLQEKEFRRLGSNQFRSSGCRVLAATHQDLRALVAAGRFREDLYQRLQVLRLVLPPLRDRISDLRELIDHFKLKHALEFSLDQAATEALHQYSWPGNIRELENLTIRLGVMHPNSVVSRIDLPSYVSSVTTASAINATAYPPESEKLAPSHDCSLRSMQNRHILEVVKSTQGRMEEAASILGIGRTTLYRKLQVLRSVGHSCGYCTSNSCTEAV